MTEYRKDSLKKEYLITVHKPKSSLENLQKDSEETVQKDSE